MKIINLINDTYQVVDIKKEYKILYQGKKENCKNYIKKERRKNDKQKTAN